MQNIDFYMGNVKRPEQPQFDGVDPEYFSRLSNFQNKDEHKKFKKASRILSLIIALCIISFTAGLVIGIKFASESEAQLVDPHTKEAVNGLGKKVATMINNNEPVPAPDNKTSFPKSEYPYVIRVGKQFNKAQSLDIANSISSRGHTVILSKEKSLFKIFIGPYKDYNLATNALKTISAYSLHEDIEIIRR
jgi:hypothetical protein